MSVRFERRRRKNNFQVKQVILNPNCPNHEQDIKDIPSAPQALLLSLEDACIADGFQQRIQGI